VQNNRQQELEYKTVMSAPAWRGDHDGWPNLGFLKLQVAQMQKSLERGDIVRLEGSLQVYHQTLTEAYHDARDTIDGLRISPSGNSLQDWLPQMLNEFQENISSQLEVSLTCLDIRTELPSEIQAQMIRIIQEALSNVRNMQSQPCMGERREQGTDW
jgi:nitrate/nitrite-specific signal transduction histidine kinase